MPGKVTLRRQDGTTIYVEPDQARKLKILGYTEVGAREANLDAEEVAKEAHYSSTGHQVSAGIEGVLRGASLGATDYLLDDPDIAERAKYNPGISAASEIVGAVGGSLVTGTPASLVSRGAAAAVKGTGVVRGAARGVLEGAAFGGAMGANHAYLDGKPITAEAVLHGVGWGSLFGAGLGGVAGGLASRGAKNVAKGVSMADEGDAALMKAGGAGGDDFAVREAAFAQEAAALRKAEADFKLGGPKFEATPGAFKAAAEAPFRSMKAEAKRAAEEIGAAIKTTDAILANNRKALRELGFDRTMSEGAMGRARIEVQAAANRASKAMNKKGFTEDGVAKALEDFESTVAKVYKKAGLADTGSGKQALMEHMKLKLVQKELQKFPHTAEQFAAMSPKRAEDMFAVFNEAKKLSAYPTISKALEQHANKVQEAVGLSPTGLDGLRKAWEQGAKQLKAERTAVKLTDVKRARAELAVKMADLDMEKAAAKVANAGQKADDAEPGFGRKAVAWAGGLMAYKAVASTGHPLAALGVASRVRNSIMKGGTKTPELVAARNATLGRIKQAVGKYQVKAGKAAAVLGPKIEPLTRKLDGTLDTSTKDKSQLAMNRINELAMASTHVKETMFRAIEPIAIEQPELGPALHQASLSAFAAFRSMIPSDPGVVSGLKSIWKPSQLQAAVMSRQIAVFQDPVGVAEEMLFTGVFDPIRVKAMKEIAPQVYEHLRNEMLVRVQEPGFMDGMNYKDQWALGALLDIPIHSGMRPEFIAASQALHMTRNQPLPTPAMPGGSDAGGRPAADTPGATQAQITTQR